MEENSSHTDSAFDIMVSHFKRRSGPSSPGRVEPRNWWYSAPPRLQMYSVDMINVLLNLARGHLSPTFAIFSSFEVTATTRIELCLAMAAVGALFSTVEGNTAVAKALYNDARRPHLDQTLQTETPSFRSALDSAKTFILLEIYGICSGDKRSYEFWEAFHCGTLQACKACWDGASSDPDLYRSEQLSLLSEAATVLESYRVLILFRPPFFSACQDFRPLAPEALLDNDHPVITDLLSLLTPTGSLHAPCGNLRSLASLIPYVWMSSPRGQELSQKPQLWKREFVELALERWMEANAKSPSPPNSSNIAHALLYHLAHINLHTNLSILQRFAPQFCHPREDDGDDNRTLDSLRAFVNGVEFQTAHWHAKTMLQVVKEAVATSNFRHPNSSSRSQLMEPPHLPYCIYFATLVLWYKESAPVHLDCARDNRIENGMRLMSKLRVHVARILEAALSELLSTAFRGRNSPHEVA